MQIQTNPDPNVHQIYMNTTKTRRCTLAWRTRTRIHQKVPSWGNFQCKFRPYPDPNALQILTDNTLGPKPWIGLPRSSFTGKSNTTFAFSSTPRTLAHSLIPFQLVPQLHERLVDIEDHKTDRWRVHKVSKPMTVMPSSWTDMSGIEWINSMCKQCC